MKRRWSWQLVAALATVSMLGVTLVPGVALADDSGAPMPAATPEAPATPEPPSKTDAAPDKTPAPAPQELAPAPKKVPASPGATTRPFTTFLAEAAPRAEVDLSTPADTDVMPDGPLKLCATGSFAASKPATYANTKSLTSVSVNLSCAKALAETAMDDWTGMNFLPALTTFTVTGFDGLELPREGLAFFTKLKTVTLTSNNITTMPALGTLPEATSLNLTDNKLVAVNGLAGLPKLTTLTLTNNSLTTVENLDDLVGLVTLTLTGNQLTSLDGLGALPQLTRLTAQDNALTALTVPSSVGLPRLSTLDVSKNQISDASAVGDPAIGPTVNASLQTLTHERIEALRPQALDTLLQVSPTLPTPSWTPGADGGRLNMAAVSSSSGTFAAARAGEWSLTWSARQAKVTFSGTVEGQAIGSAALDVSLDDPGPTVEGSDAVFRASVSGLDPDDFTYQWYRGTTASNAAPVAGATSATFTIPGVSRSDNGAYVKVVVDAKGVSFQTAATQLAVQPTIVDPGVRSCLERFFGGGFGVSDLLNLTGTLDCSDSGIVSLVDLPLFRTNNVKLDFSNNSISDLSPLVKTGDTLQRSGEIDLSDNLISDVTPLAKSTISFRNVKLTLDGNRISDNSSLSVLGAGPTSATTTNLSIQRQVVGAAGVDVDETFVVPRAINVVGGTSPLTFDGQPVPPSFDTEGAKNLAWNEAVSAGTKGVSFAGTFVVPVGLGTALLFSPNDVVGGHPVNVRAYGFAPGETVTLTWQGGSTLLTAQADGAGMLNTAFVAPYLDGDKQVTATGASSDRRATFSFTLTNDEVVKIPDAALRACINQAIMLPADSVLYRTRVDRVAAAFVCRSKGVTDLTGIENLKVSSMDLAGNALTSLDSLATLDETTTTLTLANNEIDRLGAVQPQPTLRAVNLSQNRLKDFAALGDGRFAPTASITAIGQLAEYPVQLAGITSAAPVVPVLGDVAALLSYPDAIVPVDQSITWESAGEYTVRFDSTQERDTSETSPSPLLRAAGDLLITVVDRGAPKVAVSPLKVYPTKQVNIVATGFDPGEDTVITLNSAPRLLGTATADDLGIVRLNDVVIARDVPAGLHSVRVQGTSSDPVSTPLTVLAYPTKLVDKAASSSASSAALLSRPALVPGTSASALLVGGTPRTLPRALPLGPALEVGAAAQAAEENSQPTDPTAQGRELFSGQSGWGLTRTGWSLLAVALLAMAAGLGVAAWSAGRGAGESP